MVSLFCLLVLQIGSCVAVHPTGRWSAPAFASFIQQHGREYTKGSDEYEHRLSIYKKRVKEVESLNNRPRRLWTAGVNHLTDWTDEELSRLRGWKGVAGRKNGLRGAAVSHHSHGHSTSLRQKGRASPLPEEISWVHLNASKVKHNQGSCGSCWATASVLALEANHEIHQGFSRSFSTQELVNCVSNNHKCGGTGGCDGATVDLAMDYVLKYGLKDATETPYVGIDQECTADLSLVEGADEDDLEEIVASGVHAASEFYKGPSAFGMLGWDHLPENKYEPLMRALVEHGPVAVSLAATPWGPYTSGIFDGCEPDAVVDHAVTLVGYGNDDTTSKKFWTIQNSWGPDWGEQGRIRILRRDSDETECGIDRQPEMGTACDGGPTEVTVCGMCGILYDSIVPLFGSDPK